MAKKSIPKETPSFFTKKIIALIILVIVVLVIVVWIWGTYNSLVTKDQSVQSQWSNVETQYQRRIDLIPNLVSSVKGYMTFEKDLLTNITALRSGWTQASTIDDKIKYQTQLDTAISRLLVVYENYPDLKSNEIVAQLMDELAGTENRISVERSRYNDKVRDFNTAVKIFPGNIIAGWFNFQEKHYYQAASGADVVPVVNLG
ncbi:MAG: LemA family protein [Candidatus Aenigmarchaeota archaeon]|nr:LemA family protein [Candidatus Aenigmarchaeota archaeon]